MHLRVFSMFKKMKIANKKLFGTIKCYRNLRAKLIRNVTDFPLHGFLKGAAWNLKFQRVWGNKSEICVKRIDFLGERKEPRQNPFHFKFKLHKSHSKSRPKSPLKHLIYNNQEQFSLKAIS